MLKHADAVQMVLELPEEIVEALGSKDSVSSASVLEELALSLYQRGALSGGKTAKILGLSRREFHDLVKRAGTIPPFDLEDFKAELTRVAT